MGPTTSSTDPEPSSSSAGLAARLGSGAEAAGLPPPPFPALRGSEPGSFAYDTISRRLPAILDSMISDVEAEVAEVGCAAGAWDEAATQQIAAGLSELRALRAAMLADAPLEPLQLTGAAERTRVLLEAANACLQLAVARQQKEHQQQEEEGRAAAVAGGDRAGAVVLSEGRPTWLGLPWLLVECYMYTAIHAAMQRQPPLAACDPFQRQKTAAWAKSAAAAADMAAEVELLHAVLTPQQAEHQHPESEPPGHLPPALDAALHRSPEVAARAACLAGMQMALWGNKADLSLLVNAAGLDAQALKAPETRTGGLQTSGTGDVGTADGGGVSASAPEGAPLSHVIVDDSEAVWAVMRTLRSAAGAAGVVLAGGEREEGGTGVGGRLDIVLDNSGLELFADLCLADLLTEAGVAQHVVLHGKVIPWFVSDTLEGDLQALLESCMAEEPPSEQVSSAAWQPVRRLANRWRSHLTGGRWRWTAHPFWCTPVPFSWMAAAAPDLYSNLAGSDLVIFKGDLNYRKLTHDCRWPHTTPFQVALQEFGPAPTLALRTLKADVVVGLAAGQSEWLNMVDASWLVNGKWGMVQANM